METTFTIIGLSIAAIGLLFAIKTYKLQFKSKPTEELEHLKVLFRSTQTLSLQVQQELEKFANETNAWQNHFISGITYKAYLEEMKNFYKTDLSDELLERLVLLDLTKSNIASITKRLENQYTALSQINSQLRLQSKQYKSLSTK